MSGFCSGNGIPGQCACAFCFNTREKQDRDYRDLMRRVRDEPETDRYSDPYGYHPYRRDVYSPPPETVERLRKQVDSLQSDVRRLNVLVEKLISIFLPGENKTP